MFCHLCRAEGRKAGCASRAGCGPGDQDGPLPPLCHQGPRLPDQQEGGEGSHFPDLEKE